MRRRPAAESEPDMSDEQTQTLDLKALDKNAIKLAHSAAKDVLADVKRRFFQEQATYDDLKAAAQTVVRIRQEIELRCYGQAMPQRKAQQMLLGLMR